MKHLKLFESFADYTSLEIPKKLLGDLKYVLKVAAEKNIETPYLTKLVSGDTSELLEAYDEYRGLPIQLPYEDKNRFSNWVLTFFPNKVQQDFLAKYGAKRIKQTFGSPYLNF